MQLFGLNVFYLALWLRARLARRLFPMKVSWLILEDETVRPPAGLSLVEHGAVWLLTVLIMAAGISGTIAAAVFALRLIYG